MGAPAPALGGGLFGAPAAVPALGFNGMGAPGQPAQPAAPPAPAQGSSHDGDVFEQWQRQMVKAWDDKDYKLCSFKHIVFNDMSQAGADGLMVPPPADQMAQARAQSLAASDTGLWERADAHNPNPSRFLPVQITGFNALNERRTQQIQAAKDVYSKLKEAQTELQGLEDQRNVAIQLRLRHYNERQQLLAHRVLRLQCALERQHVLRCHGGAEPPLGQSELSWIQRLKSLSGDMNMPDVGRLMDVADKIQREASLNERHLSGSGVGMPSAYKLRVDTLEELLMKQQEAVRKLIEVSKKDLKDVAIAVDEANKANAPAVPIY